MNSISLVTHNVLGTPFLTTHRPRNYLLTSILLPTRLSYLGKNLNNSGADFLCLQEVHLYFSLKILKKNLPNYPYLYYKPQSFGPQGGLVVFAKNPLSSWEYIDYENKGSLRNKSFTAVVSRIGALILKIDKSPFYLLNTYLTANTDHDWEFTESKHTPLKKLQLEQLSAIIHNFTSNKNELLLAGDLNIQKNSKLYLDFLQTAGLKNVFTENLSYTQHPDFLPVHTKPPVLDYLLATEKYGQFKTLLAKKLFANKEKLLGQKIRFFVSDHLGLKADLTYENISSEKR